MKIDKLILSRRTIHDFESTAVPEEAVLAALNLALWAPNHRSTNPWRFYWIGVEGRKKIAEESVKLKQDASPQPLSEAMKESLRHKMLAAPVLIVVSQPKVQDLTIRREDYASIAAGLQNAALYLWDLEIGTKWSTGKVTTSAAAYQAAGTHPEEEEIIGFFWIGRALRKPTPPPRIDLEKTLRRTP